MQIEILYVRECPNLPMARKRVQEALAEAGLNAPVREVEVATEDDARRLGMRGSPTILLNGSDLFAGEEAASVSCRLYRSEAGLEGAPTVPQLAAALVR